MITPTEDFWNAELRAQLVPEIDRLSKIAECTRNDAWRYIARKILAGEYNNADSSTRKSLWYGLAHLGFPECKKAADMLMGKL